MTRLIVAVLLTTTVPLVPEQVVPPPLKPGEVSVEISLVPATGAAATTAPTRMAIASPPMDGRAGAEVVPASFQWSATGAGGGRTASYVTRIQ
jgi:hypothetical protein